jgi:hypothetical protein
MVGANERAEKDTAIIIAANAPTGHHITNNNTATLAPPQTLDGMRARLNGGCDER